MRTQSPSRISPSFTCFVSAKRVASALTASTSSASRRRSIAASRCSASNRFAMALLRRDLEGIPAHVSAKGVDLNQHRVNRGVVGLDTTKQSLGSAALNRQKLGLLNPAELDITAIRDAEPDFLAPAVRLNPDEELIEFFIHSHDGFKRAG